MRTHRTKRVSPAQSASAKREWLSWLTAAVGDPDTAALEAAITVICAYEEKYNICVEFRNEFVPEETRRNRNWTRFSSYWALRRTFARTNNVPSLMHLRDDE